MNARQLAKRSPFGPALRRVHRWYSRRPTSVEVEGFQVLIPRRDVKRYAAGFEQLTTAWLPKVVKPGMSAVDVGAAIGVFSLMLCRLVGPDGRVTALEPSPTSIRLLERNALRNNVRFEVIEAAASSEDGARPFFLTDSSDSHAFFPHPLIAPSSQVDIRTVRLDSVVEEADFIKIDVEGAEIDVLEGAARLIGSRPALVVEWVPSCQLAAGRDPGELPAWLSRAGYRFQVFDEFNHAVTPVKEVFRALELGTLPPEWYANLCCESA